MTSGAAHGLIEHAPQALDDAHVLHLAYHWPKAAVRFADWEFFHSVSDVSGTRRLHCGAKCEESLTSGDAAEYIELVA